MSIQRADSYNKAWTLTEAAWEKLMDRLADDPEEAGSRYERIRARLIRHFEWRNLDHPEELADETINRVARRLEEGLTIHSGSAYAYFMRVALLVAKENYRTSKRQSAALNEALQYAQRHEPSHEEETPVRLRCLAECLAELPPDQRDLIVKYHSIESKRRIPARRKLADSLEIPLNSLRVRACRIRSKLEMCIELKLRAINEASGG